MSGQVRMPPAAEGETAAAGSVRESAVPGGAAPGGRWPTRNGGNADPGTERGSAPASAGVGEGRESAVPEVGWGGRARQTPSWAAPQPGADAVAELAQRMGGLCASAAHSEEVAALLESEGLTDEQITGRYGHRDLFSLAETLYARVPRAFPEPEPGPDPWRTSVGRCVLRGLTFALPGVAYVLGGRWAGGPDGPFGVTAAVAGWALAALVSWGWNQGLAHRAGLLLLARRPQAAARCLLAGGALGTVPATAAALALTGPAHPAPPLFALGQALYMAAATTVLVLGRERLLLYVLAPLTVAAACGTTGLPSPLVASVLGGTVAAAVAMAVRTARRTAAQDGPPPTPRGQAGSTPPERVSARRRGLAGWRRGGTRRGATSRAVQRVQAGELFPRGGVGRAGGGGRFGWRLAVRRGAVGWWWGSGGEGSSGGPPEAHVPLVRSVPLGLGGLAAGVLVVAAALAGELVAALSVSMGVAEWLLFRFRGRCLLALRGTGVAERLLARSWRVLARCLGGYAAALVALAAVESAALPGAPAWNVPHLAVLLALGGTLWLALLLQSCGRPWPAAGVLTCAATTALALLAAHAATPGTVLGLTGAGAALVLLATATTVTARVTTHR